MLLLLGAAFVTTDYLFFLRLWSAILSSPLPAVQSTRIILSSVLSLFLVFLFYSNLLSCLSTMYASRELRLLLALPVSFRRVFVTTFVATVGRSSAMFVLFGLPALIALVRAFHGSAAVLVCFLPFLLAFILIPGALGLSVCHVLMRVLPRRRVHQALLVAGLCVGVGLIAGVRMLRVEYLWGSQTEQIQVVNSLVHISKQTPSLVPAGWMVTVLLGMLAESDGNTAWTASALVSLSIACLAGCYIVTARLYLQAWSGSQTTSDATVRSRAGHVPGLPSAVGALVIKDILSIRRQLHRWSQIIMMIPLMALYVLNLTLLPIEGVEWAGIVVWVNLGVVGFLVAAVGARFLVPAISADGMAYWILRASPVRTQTVVLTKFALYSLPVLLLSLGCSICIQLMIPAARGYYLTGLCCTAVLTLALSALAIGVGAAFPRFEAQNDLEISLGTGGLLYMLLALLFVGFSDWWLLRPFLRMLPRVREILPMDTVSLPWRIGVFAAVSMVCGCAGLALGIQRLRAFER
jgi:ABC-2 type transport system permease protein